MSKYCISPRSLRIAAPAAFQNTPVKIQHVHFFVNRLPSVVRGPFSPFFRTFAAMKKWITTYLLFVVFILFSLSGMANRKPAKETVKKNLTSFSKKVRSIYFKINSDADHPGSNCPDEICSSIYNIQCAGYSQLVPLLTGEYMPVMSFAGKSDTITVPATQVPNGYLLHLFPSHYFW
jgi:hypothetical protein